ncbi:hypothetical protein BgAZ_109520 [Babesia gibsoni]|uniref:Uncharacterized protein n=1 Tax=Babesia gibsoni TaxID=33632 RepID=A0AAD8UU54_BABGI|nr:hypothetical protein BgAZ_109520 [Babesia gibsoni]
MGPFDGLIASSNARYRVKLITSSGLERLLVSELSSLSNDCSILTGGSCFVEANVDLYNLWKIIHGSRICEQLWIHICEPFHARNVRTFMRALNNAEWRGFIPFSSGLRLPYVKVNTNNSQLYHTGMIKKLLHEVIKAHCSKSLKLQGDELPKVLQRRGHLPLCPTLMVNIDNDMCEVLANSSGDLTERPWSSASALDARISPSMVAAIAYRLELMEKIRHKEISVIWDPLCHIGTVLFELHSFVKRCRFRPLGHIFPLSNFPLNCRETTKDAAASVYDDGEPCNVNLRLIGSDVLNKYVTEAEAVYRKYRFFDKRTTTNSTNNGQNDEVNEAVVGDESIALKGSEDGVSVEFITTPLEDANVNYNNTLVLTNLYYGNKERRKEFVSAHGCFEELLLKAPQQLLQNVYVIGTENFRKNSKFVWQPELKFNNNGVIVMLLKLVSIKSGV